MTSKTELKKFLIQPWFLKQQVDNIQRSEFGYFIIKMQFVHCSLELRKSSKAGITIKTHMYYIYGLVGV